MLIEMPKNNRPQIDADADGDGSKSTLDFNSFDRVDMKALSQSELYSLSRSSSFDFHLLTPENDVIPNTDSDHRHTSSITTTTTPRRIYAFSHRCTPRRRISGSDSDVQATENRLILRSLETLLNDSKRKRKKRSKNEEEFEGLGVIDVDGEAIDLKFLASAADGVFESELNRMTEGMVGEDEFLGFLRGLEGRWGSSRRRRKYVEATVVAKALPVNWKILLSLRPRARRPSLYCRRFVSPSEKHFNSCKDVVIYLKSQFVTNNANPPEGDMIQMGMDCQMDLESGGQVPRSSHLASEIDVMGTNNLHKVKCNICTDSFTSVAGLESHLQMDHGDNIQMLGMDTLTRKHSVPSGLLLVQERNVEKKTVVNKGTVTRPYELNDISLNVEGSSNESENNSEGKRNFKTRCIWCQVEFFRESVDAETLANSCGFICPKCKEDVSWRFENALSEWTQHAEN